MENVVKSKTRMKIKGNMIAIRSLLDLVHIDARMIKNVTKRGKKLKKWKIKRFTWMRLCMKIFLISTSFLILSCKATLHFIFR